MHLSDEKLKGYAVLRIRDVYPGSRIQKQQQKRGVKKNLLSYLFL